ncbi:putative disease resistance protein RGA3 [Dichanthelium oligosanthes]|uniref:Putative disease resistance protein RGA3 n=1 Tax=Dichanthelium oligosanthes TaxID=888268 RepID=A0A1E5VZF6_9POAL|nr:putative disease resistance protein RGA3 [Dichanthelium oligosanthes]
MDVAILQNKIAVENILIVVNLSRIYMNKTLCSGILKVPVLTAIATGVGKILGNVISAEINKQMFFRTEVKRLKVNYEQIMVMIKKAEQTATVLNEETIHWMKRIKDHMYDVDDVVDTWMIKDKKHSTVPGSCETESLQYAFGNCKTIFLKSKMYGAIKVLNEDFDQILKLQLGKMPDDRIIRSYGKAAPDYNADIIGHYVDKDCDSLIKLLINQQNIYRLIAIVGMVGIGKTTLARKIYDNISRRKDEVFDIKIWIRFSKDLSSLIMWSDSRKEDATKAQLQQLGIKIAEKKFFLVIDDVWTENIWETLLEGPLQHGKHGSKVILTTRHKHVAKRIGAGHIHYVKRMNDDDALRLLCQRASINQSDEEELRDIGEQIVKKCDGLPLAIRSIGRTLRGREPTRHDWENACRTAFQDLSPEEQYIINLSFQDLPSYMRQCFLYCSILPEGYSIKKQYITRHWISEGFIEKKRNSTIEEIAEDCFDELIGRGLLQLEVGLYVNSRATMPVIIRSFARDLSDHENFCNELESADNLLEARRVCIVKSTENSNQDTSNIEDDENYDTRAIVEGTVGMNESNHINEEVRNDPNNRSDAIIDVIFANNETNNQIEVAESDENNGEVATLEGSVENNESVSNNCNREDDGNGANNSMSAPYRLGSMTSLRTLILCNSELPKGFLALILKRLKLLRLLDLHKTNIEVLPNTIGRLEHLRYLNISDTKIRKVPETIKSLRMLQYLLLKNCKLTEFPKAIQLLQNLRSIDISGTGLDDARWNFDHMEQLSSIHGFYLKSDSVQKLLNLRFPKTLKSLQIVNLEKAVELPAGSEPPLVKLQLKDLELCYTSDCRPYTSEAELENFERVINRLRPHKRLVSIKIKNYFGVLYPSWISRKALRNLQRLHLQNFLLCEQLPTLRDLPQLKFLTITGFDKLRTLCGDLRTNQTMAFPKLEQLQISNMKKLYSLLDIEGQHLPCLQRISILSCPELTTIPSCLKESMALARFEIDKESRVGIKKMLEAFREGIVFTEGYQRPADETTEMLEAAENSEPVPIARINGASSDGDHVLYEDADTEAGASGNDESIVGANLNADTNDVGPVIADVNEGVLGNGDNMVVPQAGGGEHNLDDVGDRAAPPIQMDGHHLFRYFKREPALLLVVAIISFIVLFAKLLRA